MNKDKIVEKIKKLLALGKSGYNAEAKTALEKAAKLMKQYDLEVTLDEVKEESITFNSIKGGFPRRNWVSVLSLAVAKMFDCMCLTKKDNSTIAFVGIKSDTELAEALFHFLINDWKKESEKGWKQFKRDNPSVVEAKLMTAVKWKTNHGIGYAASVYERVDEIIQERRKVVKGTKGALVPIEKADRVRDWVDSTGISERNISLSYGVGSWAGDTAGKTVKLGDSLEAHKDGQSCRDD